MKGDKTTMLALTAAVVILAIVGIKSFLDYKVAELEKIHGGKSAEAPVLPPPNASTPTLEPAPGAETPISEKEFQSSIDQMPRSVLPPVPPSLLETPADTPPPQPASDPRADAEREATKKEIAMYQEKLNQLRSGSASTPGPAPSLAGEPAVPRSPTNPGSAVAAMENKGNLPDLSGGPITGAVPARPSTPPQSASNPGFGPQGGLPPTPVQTEAEIAALAEQVKKQPVIAKVVDYDAEWAILVLSGGSENNIKPEMRFAVRRGGEILGFIKVTEVEPTQSVAELMSPNKHSPTARKPQRGDDVIAFNIF